MKKKGESDLKTLKIKFYEELTKLARYYSNALDCTENEKELNENGGYASELAGWQSVKSKWFSFVNEFTSRLFENVYVKFDGIHKRGFDIYINRDKDSFHDLHSYKCLPEMLDKFKLETIDSYLKGKFTDKDFSDMLNLATLSHSQNDIEALSSTIQKLEEIKKEKKESSKELSYTLGETNTFKQAIKEMAIQAHDTNIDLAQTMKRLKNEPERDTDEAHESK